MSRPHRAAGSARRGLTIGLTLALAASLVPAATWAAPNAEVGYPVFRGSPEPVPDPGVPYTTGSMMQAVFDRDVAAGAGTDTDHDFWMDRMLVRTGTAGTFGDENQWLFTRGRAVFMKTHEPATLGFGGEVAYWESMGNLPAYTVTVHADGEAVTLREDTAARKQTPSYWRSEHVGDGLRVVQTKFVTDANVMVTALEVHNTGDADRTVELRASSPFVSQEEGDELTGGAVAFNAVTTVYPRLSGDGFAPEDGAVVRQLTVPAGEAAGTKVQLGWVTEEIEDSLGEYRDYRALSPAEAYTRHVTEYNEWWARNTVYLDTPEDNIDKTLFYRWWLLRFNYLDADMPGNAYQFPTAMEGVLGYNNAIDLTVGMFVDDLKYVRDPIYSYGGWVSTGETSRGGRFVDNPGDPANWNASHTQYISEAAWRSYQLHGGPLGVVENLARYAEGDAKGQLESYDSNDNGLLETNWNAWTGNDADAVSFDYYGRTNERAESAYVYSGALAAAAAYRMLGDDEKVAELEAVAEQVRTGVLEHLWDPEDQLLKHRDLATGNLIPWKEINNYYPFAVGLMPREGEADYTDDYVEALRLFADDDEYPIFPFYTANQADQAERGGGSNNFSIINSTVTFRMVARALRDYPTEYIDAEWYKKLLYWNAYAHYMNDGDNRLPDANEFWADGGHDPQRIGYRSWIHHTILGTTNFTVIEDAMGLRPREDHRIELYPIDVDWPHFTANNIRYRDRDLTITWDAPGDGERHYGQDVPEGYSVFLDGELAFTVDSLTHVLYDPATGEVSLLDDVVNDVAEPAVLYSRAIDVAAPQEVTFPADARVVDLFAKAGQDISPDGVDLVNLAEGAQVSASYSAQGWGPAGAVDGSTVNEPFWGTRGSPNEVDHLEVDLGEPQAVDRVRVYFYQTSSSSTREGYAEPAMYTVEHHDGEGWVPVPGQASAPAHPRANLNEVRFPEVTTQRLRVSVTHADGYRTGVKELQVHRTGDPAPAAENAAPQVIAFQDLRSERPGQARLVATVKDDALPRRELSHTWSVVDAPEGGTAIVADPGATTTVVRFSATGEYTLRLTANDGERTTSRDVVVQGTAAGDGGANIAPAATPSASYTASWNDVDAVNNGRGQNSGGAQTELWGTWTGNEPATRWLQYTWDTPVRIVGSEIMFWWDAAPGQGTGVSVPRAWSMQYRDDATGEWRDMPNPSGYGTARTGTNVTTFDAVRTTAVRATFQAYPDAGGRYAAVGVSEWEIVADLPESLTPVHVRTLVGRQPSLPTEVEAVYGDGSRVAMPVVWEPVSEESLAREGEVRVTGIVDGTSLPASATVWVRPTDAVVVNGVEPVRVTTAVGTPPVLPAHVTVLYNDGSRQTLPVEWDAVDPQDYARDGTVTVEGTVTGAAGATATATVVVGTGGEPGPALDVSVETGTRCVVGRSVVTVRVTNEDDLPLAVGLESDFGTREIPALDPGRSIAHAFTTRLRDLPAGSLAVTVSAQEDDEEVTVTVPASYDARSCG